MNKITVIIAVAAFIIGEAVGFALGFATGRNRPGDPPVQSQQGAASASADAAQENSRRSAAEADAFRTFARQRIEDLDRLEILAANDRLYDVEKIEIGKIIDRLAADFPAIRNDYSRETGRVKNLSEWVRKIKEADRAAAILLQQKAVDDAKIAAEKRMDVLKRSAR